MAYKRLCGSTMEVCFRHLNFIAPDWIGVYIGDYCAKKAKKQDLSGREYKMRRSVNGRSTEVSTPWVDVVYLKDGEMVNFSELSFMDDNQELQPGTTLSDEGTCYSDSGFDDVVIAINGRK